jgi:hypothetical protein
MISENSRLLERTIIVSLPSDRAPNEQEIGGLATRLRTAFPVTDNEFADLLKRLHARMAIEMDTGVYLVADHRPWLSARKPDIDPFYWERFQQLLTKKDWPPKVIGSLDRVTDDILDLLGNPAQTAHWSRRGLVVGDVQSGKTATYTALCCKAGDAGYRLIILLTGTLESLRRQTQERLDEGFVGLDSSGELTKIRSSRAVGVGLIDPRKAAGVFTSREKDFKQSLLNALGFRLDIFQNPVLVVVKKNKRILENLEKWLTEFNAGPGKRIDAPVLVIDDEADSASVNTRPANEDPTQINRRIRSLLQLFTHSSYVGFTATPFANVFIDPDTEDEMLGSDLFPRDFIYSLEAPTNYFGPQAIFGDDAQTNVLRTIIDADLTFPQGHKAVLAVSALPPSLLEAARTYLLGTTIRDLRGEGATHRSMLVNVSRFTAVQDQVASLLHAWLSQVQQDIRNYSQLSPSEALRNATIGALHATWQAEFLTGEFDWKTMQRALLNGVLPVVIQAVNQRTGAASLDYAKHRENGLRVIAVGGNSLSRGLTLEGLSASYFFRNSQMYDTLLQMGRWFGYRDGYADLCRVWLTQDAMYWYEHITMATDELRAEFRRMRQQDLTPKDFGLKVRAHPDSLIVTAQNKMRQSKKIERIISIRKKYLETPRLKRSENIIRANRVTVERFIEDLHRDHAGAEAVAWGNPFWQGIPKELVAGVIRSFDVHPLNISFQADDLAAFITKTNEDALQSWDVVVPQGVGATISFGGMSMRLNMREVKLDQSSILVSGRHRRVASRGIERAGLPLDVVKQITDDYKREKPGKNVPDERYREHRNHPLLIVHLVEPTAIPADAKKPGDILAALGLSFPDFDDSDIAKRVKYVVNLVEWNAMVEDEADDFIEEDTDDDTN